MTSVGAPAAAGLGPLGGLVVVAVAAQLALGGCGSGDDTGAPPAEDPTTEPHVGDDAQPSQGELPSPARPLRPTAAVPRPTTLRIVNRLSVPVELYRGGFVDRRGPMLRYLNLVVEAVGVQGSLHLEGDGSICPDRAVVTSPSIVRRPPCQTEQCVLTLRPGAELRIPWSGWLLAPDDRRAGPDNAVVCWMRRAPLPVEHVFRVCGTLSGVDGGRTCASTQRSLPTDDDLVLAFEPNPPDSTVDDAPAP